LISWLCEGKIKSSPALPTAVFQRVLKAQHIMASQVEDAVAMTALIRKIKPVIFVADIWRLVYQQVRGNSHYWVTFRILPL
jgi:hypothetical protein